MDTTLWGPFLGCIEKVLVPKEVSLSSLIVELNIKNVLDLYQHTLRLFKTLALPLPLDQPLVANAAQVDPFLVLFQRPYALPNFFFHSPIAT